MDIPRKNIKQKWRIFQLTNTLVPFALQFTRVGDGFKTTITTLLGYYLANKGKKVLLIDIDPQCSLSLAAGVDPAKVDKTDFTIYHLVTPNKWANIAKVKFSQYIDAVPDIHAPKEFKKMIKGSYRH
jgi:cellulose biosynthesis protein BcsQ